MISFRCLCTAFSLFERRFFPTFSLRCMAILCGSLSLWTAIWSLILPQNERQIFLHWFSLPSLTVLRVRHWSSFIRDEGGGGHGRVYLVCWKNQEFHSYSWLLLSSFTCPFPSFENSQESSSFYWHIIFISFLSNCVPLHHFEKCWLRICYWNLCLDFSSRQFHICSFENEFSGFPAYFRKEKNRFVFSIQKLVYG